MAQTSLISADAAQALALAEAVQVSSSGIVSRTVVQTPEFRTVLFAFDSGQELTAHTSRRRALVQILSGACDFFFAGEWRRLESGALLHMPPGHPHAVGATQRAFIRRYRAAVNCAAKSNVADSFDRLDSLVCLRECDPAERRDALAADYRAAIARKQKPLIVVQTREDARSVNEAVREQLRASGELPVGRALTTFAPVDMSETKSAIHGFTRLSITRVFFGPTDASREVTSASSFARSVAVSLSYRYADRLTVTRAQEMKISVGDRLQLKLNGKSAEGAPLNNGEIVTVRRLKRNGAIVVQDGNGFRKTIAANQRVLMRGYAVTSYGSQGKTADTVIFADAASRAATSADQ